MRLLLPLLLALAAPSARADEVEMFPDSHLSWSELAERGGLAIGEAYRDRTTRWILGVDCNVSGARAVTRAPALRDDEQGVRRVVSQVDAPASRITIYVLVATPREGLPDPECRGAFLGYPPAGRYEVHYLEPDGVSSVIGEAVVPEYRLRNPRVPASSAPAPSAPAPSAGR